VKNSKGHGSALRGAKPPINYDRVEEAARTIELKIRQAEKTLRGLHQDFEMINKAALPQLSYKLTDITKWTARRRTLIEIWEFLTDQVWKSGIKE